MRKFKVVYMLIVVIFVITIFSFEVFAATYMSLNIKGEVSYFVADIGAKIWACQSITNDSETYEENFQSLKLTTSSVVETETNNVTGNVYYLFGATDEFSNLKIDLGEQTVPLRYTLTLYLFMKNMGPRNIVPEESSSFDNSENIEVVEEDLYFDISELGDSYDLYSLKSNSTSLKSYLETVNSLSAQAQIYTFGIDSLNVGDTYLKKISFTADSETALSSFSLNFGFMADTYQTADNILTVYQDKNSIDPSWTKYGHNSLLSATATKIENNSLSALASAVNNSDALGNADISNLGLANSSLADYYALDDYYNEVIYKDIDLVNIDIETGEPIGRLSDINYSFEWYGGTVTLHSGDQLASGRILEYGLNNQIIDYTFTVDVYTYYPTFYIRRWLKGNYEYISISDEEFNGSVKIDNYYLATFESTIFNPNGDVSTNSEGKVIPRSYIFDYAPLTYNSPSYVKENYLQNGSIVDGYNNISTPTEFLQASTNLTNDWKNSNIKSIPGYLPKANISQGENYTSFAYTYLYIIKYAHNNAQNKVGQGNSASYSLYTETGVTSTTPSGNIITTGDNSTNSFLESIKGGGVIGCYNTATTNDAYTHTTNAMSYGYDFSSYIDRNSNNSNSKAGLYSNQYLTYNTGNRRVLLDGYVGSDNYTSVFCLGQCNPWGNTTTWLFGNVFSIETETIDDVSTSVIKCWFTFENYNGSNWYLSNKTPNEEILTSNNFNYVKMSYNIKQNNSYACQLGLSTITSNNGNQMLIGLSVKDSPTSGSHTGSCDYFLSASISNISNASYGITKSGTTNTSTRNGVFFMYMRALSSEGSAYGFRNMLVP